MFSLVFTLTNSFMKPIGIEKKVHGSVQYISDETSKNFLPSKRASTICESLSSKILLSMQ